MRNAVSEYMVDQLYTDVDVPAVLDQALPPRLKPLSAPIAVAAEPYLSAPWRPASPGRGRWSCGGRQSASTRPGAEDPRQLGVVLNTNNGTVAIDLAPLVSQFSSRLSARTNGAMTLPPGTGNIMLLKSDQLSQAQIGVKLLRLLSIPLALAALAVLAIAAVISRDRRKTLRAVAIGVLAAGRGADLHPASGGRRADRFADHASGNRDAAHAIWWVATEKLGAANITVVTVGLLLSWAPGSPARDGAPPTSRKNLTPYLRDPAVAYGTYAVIVLLLLVWAPVPAARDL